MLSQVLFVLVMVIELLVGIWFEVDKTGLGTRYNSVVISRHTAEAMVLSSSSEDVSPDFGGDSLTAGEGRHVATEANAIPVGRPRGPTVVEKVKVKTGV